MHFKLMVVGENIKEQLDKFNEYHVENFDDAKVDWYELGGRYSNCIQLKDSIETVNSARKKDISNIDDIDFFAFLKDGIWTENERQENWEKTMRDLKSEISDDDIITIIDCHF